jgi:hypothetical protein
LVIVNLLSNHKLSFWLEFLHRFMMELSEARVADYPPTSASIFRGQFDLMLAQWSGRGGGKHYWSYEKTLVSYLDGKAKQLFCGSEGSRRVAYAADSIYRVVVLKEALTRQMRWWAVLVN